MTRAELIAALKSAKGPATETEAEKMLGAAKLLGMVDDIGSFIDFNSAVSLSGPTATGHAISLIQTMRPGWFHTSGECYLSGHATIGADYNDPAHGERLRREFPIGDMTDCPTDSDEYERRQWIFSADLSEGTNRQARALLVCLLSSMDDPKEAK